MKGVRIFDSRGAAGVEKVGKFAGGATPGRAIHQKLFKVFRTLSQP